MTHLQHYGVMGMRWGKRKAQAKAWLSEAGKLAKSGLTNPFLSDKANSDSILSEKSSATILRRTLLYQKTKELKDVNDRIAVMKAHIYEQRKALESNKTKATGVLGYKTSENYAKDLVASWKAKDVKNISLDLTKGVGTAAVEFAVGFAAVYGTMTVLKKLTEG